MSVGMSSLIEHISWAPNLKRRWLDYVKMTPEKMHYLSSGKKKNTEKTERKKKKQVKKYDEIKFCFNYNLLKTWLA